MTDTTSASAAPPPRGATPGSSGRRRSPPWMRIVLIASLAINLGVGGYAIARVVAGPRFVSAGPAASLMDARKLLWTLPRERRNALREEFTDRHFNEFMGQRNRWNEARRGLAQTLLNGEASEEEIRRAYRELGEIEAATAIRWREVLADLTVQVPADARAVFANRLGHDHRHLPHWHGADRGGE